MIKVSYAGVFIASGSEDRFYQFHVKQENYLIEKIELLADSKKDAIQELLKEMDRQFPDQEWELDGYYIVNAEYTDTFGGEANYSWVKREKFIFKKAKHWSLERLARKVKKEMGLFGGRLTDFGDQVRIDFKQDNTVLFVD